MHRLRRRDVLGSGGGDFERDVRGLRGGDGRSGGRELERGVRGVCGGEVFDGGLWLSGLQRR
jgi:hypothetical protein